jgi:hypothetical protein
MEKKGAPVRLHDLGGFTGDLEKHGVNLQVKSDDVSEFEQGVELSVSIAHGLLSGLFVALPTRGSPPAFRAIGGAKFLTLAILTGHQPHLR